MELFLFIWFSFGILGASFATLYTLNKRYELTINDIGYAIFCSFLGIIGFVGTLMYLFIEFGINYGDKVIFKKK